MGSPLARQTRLAMTSLAFMFVEVPEPVWKTSTGNCPSRSPAATCSAASRMASATSSGRWPSEALAPAAAALTRPRARMKSRGMRSPEIGKFWTARWVWAP